MACFLFLIPNSEQILSGYGTSKIACHLVRGICHFLIVAEGRAQVFKFMHILKLSAIVAKRWWVGAKEGHGLVLCAVRNATKRVFYGLAGERSRLMNWPDPSPAGSLSLVVG